MPANETSDIVINAKLSGDQFNVANRNFSYRWNCSDLVPIMICP